MSVASPTAGASRVDHSLRHILIIGGLVVGLVVVTVVAMLVVAPRYQGSVRMVSEDGAWRIDELLAGVDPIYR